MQGGFRKRNTGASRFTILAKGGTSKKRGVMNKTEERFAREVLDPDPNVIEWWYECVSLKLDDPEEGQSSRYTADFMVLTADGTVFFDDVKSGGGFDNEGARVRAGAASQRYYPFKFRIVKPIAKKQGGGWDIRTL